MKYYSGPFGARYWRLIISLFMLAAVFCPQSVHADSSGLKVRLAVDADSEAPQFPLGAPIGLTMIISNDTEWSLFTKLGFSQTEFFRSLILTGPDKKKYIYISEKENVDTMPPAISFGDRQVILAEELSKDFVNKVIIVDLSQLFPMIKTEPGYYTIESRQPFIRLAEIIPIKNFGVLAPVDDVDNIWRGSVVSNQIQFYVFPPAGGLLNVRVVEDTAGQIVPLFQVPVRVFASEDAAAKGSLEEAWSKSKPLLEGTTDNAGQTHWNSEVSPCLIGEDYTIIARYSEDYQDSIVAANDSGWQEGCTGLIAKEIVFIGQAEPPAIPGDFNGDNCVDRADYGILMADLRDGEPNDPAHDLNEDGVVNIADARYLVTLFTNPRGAPCG